MQFLENTHTYFVKPKL